jgi:putative protease
MADRPSNKGLCANTCRWKYALVEEKRPGEYFPVFEEDRGVHIFNSRDLCMIEYLDQILDAGVDSIKIEGRMKSIYYVANVVRVYRKAIDEYYENPQKFKVKDEWLEELKLVSHRDYTRGFFEKRNFIDMQNIESSKYIRNADFVGVVVDINEEKILIQARNKIKKGEKLQFITPDFKNIDIELKNIYDQDGNSLDVAQPNMLFYIPLNNFRLQQGAILRRVNLLK